ncbi:hypothetical protein BpHYR1_048978 [Brachionus plicatilis]|uniref:Uncharacterized protein n=1 Tax=Brachionus plicatilis TaxID=10195 RepID=A0A3M7RWB1_BRAPC|nr:hypothetical protein BpHYR1_048978 [Brachionus plicatilis]
MHTSITRTSGRDELSKQCECAKPQLGRFWELERQSRTSSTLIKITSIFTIVQNLKVYCAHLFIYFFPATD